MRQILLDSDPGTDDVFAMLWIASLVQSKHCSLVAVTSCEGNVKGEQTYSNAVRVLNLLGLNDVPVGKGRSYEHGTPTEYHGSDGLANTAHLLPPMPKGKEYSTAPYSEDIIIEKLSESPANTITVVAIGPCTNLENAEKKHPGILKLAREIVIMGGAIEMKGNITPLAEFNVWFNPQSFQSVLDARTDTTIVPLDVTQKVLFGEIHFEKVLAHLKEVINTEHQERIENNAKYNQIMKFFSAVLEVQIKQSLKFHQARGSHSMLMHDGATILAMFYPETITFTRAHLFVETNIDSKSRGNTYIDNRHSSMRPQANALVGKEVDSVVAMSIFVEDLKRFFEGVLSEGSN